MLTPTPSGKTNSARALSNLISREKRKADFLKSLKYRARESISNVKYAAIILAFFFGLSAYNHHSRQDLEGYDYFAIETLTAAGALVDTLPQNDDVGKNAADYAEARFASKTSRDKEFTYQGGILSTSTYASCNAIREKFPKIGSGMPDTKNEVSCEENPFFSTIRMNIAGDAR